MSHLLFCLFDIEYCTFQASRSEDAEIFLWCATLLSVETSGQTWRLAGKIHCHTLTVTQMEFSYDNKYLLSVSRDRTWALHKKDTEKPDFYTTCAKSDKNNGHTRIIWTCAWAPDDRYFATGSRDKTVRHFLLLVLEVFEIESFFPGVHTRSS